MNAARQRHSRIASSLARICACTSSASSNSTFPHLNVVDAAADLRKPGGIDLGLILSDLIVHVEALNATMQHFGALTPIQREQRPLHLCDVHRHSPRLRGNLDTGQGYLTFLEAQAGTTRLRTRVVLLDRAAQSPRSVGGLLSRLYCRCPLCFDQCGVD